MLENAFTKLKPPTDIGTFDAKVKRRAESLIDAVQKDREERIAEILGDLDPLPRNKVFGYIILNYEYKIHIKTIRKAHEMKMIDFNGDKINNKSFITPLHRALANYENNPNKNNYKTIQYLIEYTLTNRAYDAMDYVLSLRTSSCHRLEQVWQDIILHSKYPIISALHAANFMKNASKLAYSDAVDYLSVSNAFEQSAITMFLSIENDHLAAILLETPDNIGNTALNIALSTNAKNFLAINRVQRILNSLWSIPQFLNEDKMTSDNNIVSFESIYFMLRYPKKFYLSPVGSYITKYIMQFLSLMLYTLVMSYRLPLEGALNVWEIALYIYVIAELFGELFEVYNSGIVAYTRNKWNFVDLAVIGCVLVMMSLRYINTTTGSYPDNQLVQMEFFYNFFAAIGSILIWSRLLNAFSLHPTLGPLIKMIIEMATDIKNFTYIMLIFIIAFTQALYFLVGGKVEGFDTGLLSCLTIFSGLLGDFSFDIFDVIQDGAYRVFVKLLFF